ncbi:MAG: HD-GYP domain-containing protein [Phycisphaerales bacterium]
MGIRYYVIFVCLAALAALPFAGWHDLALLPAESIAALLMLMCLGLVSERLSVATIVGQSGGTHSVTFIPLLASVLLFGPAAPVAFVSVVGSVGEFLFRRKGILRGSFNVAQYVLASTLGGLLFRVAGGSPQALQGVGGPGQDFDLDALPFVAFAAALLITNQLLVSGAIALSQHLPFREVWRKIVGRSGANVVYDVLLTPIAIVIASLCVELGVPGLFVAVLPLLAIRHAYLTSYRLQEANRDLLKALVKAIETRDPYTSGHSRRVQALARRIVRHLGLPERQAEDIVQAALLHDIGKIEAIYTEILSKPSSLTPEERAVIESHVTKGVELLQSLSSFRREVIEAVRHHHEREDGKGYPEGLRGSEIPLGAKIISICDAIDAMLSDRPYRRALPLDAVRKELLTYAGVQFDGRIAQAVVESRILEDHAAELALARAADGAVSPERSDRVLTPVQQAL